MNPVVSIIIPVYNQASFIRRAIASVQNQSLSEWEVLVIDDGSTDGVDLLAKEAAENDNRIHYYSNEKNEGLGYSLNRGIELSRSVRIAYLPADDIYFENHLSTLLEVLDKDPEAVLAHSGLRYDYHDSIQSSQGRTTFGAIEGTHLQLVQVMHRKVEAKWVERQQIVTDDLEVMYWKYLRPLGPFIGTGQISAEWVSHPLQRHKLINELRWWGGIHRYRRHYGVSQKLRFKSSTGHYIGYFGEVDHLIPWQIDHLIVWRPVAEKSCRSSFKIS